ncbi:MAG TPA: hypothetical protein VLF42_03160 [Burkholderiales bacterium]|nr:hypothetical protein [Burkholderiales bacterium]
MFETTTFLETPGDPYDGVPLGVEAIVPFTHEPTGMEKSRDEDRPAAGQALADPGWRG